MNLQKIGAIVVLACVLGRPLDIDQIPMQEALPNGTLDTIEVVAPVRTAENVRYCVSL